jgi:iron complex transport system permease protein
LSQLPEITFWLLGGLSGITWGKLLAILPGVLIGLLVLYLYRWRLLNLLSLKEDIACSLGASPRRDACCC